MILAISCIKFLKGGPIKILEELIKELDQNTDLLGYSKILVFVHNDIPQIKYSSEVIEFIKVSKVYTSNHLLRFFWEFIISNFLVRQHHIDKWFSLHDVSTAPFSRIKRAVYIHSPMMFLKPSLKWLLHSRQEFLFSLLYPILMRFCVNSNDLIVVQQKWFAEQLNKKYLRKNNFIVCHPRTVFSNIDLTNTVCYEEVKGVFFYPSLVRSFKSHELLLNIAELNPELLFLITSSGASGTHLERRLFEKYGHLENVRWLGYLTHDEIKKVYKTSEFVIFPSEIETWGLPLTEARVFDKKIIIFEGRGYYKGPLNAYHKTYLFNRSALRFKENLRNIESFRVNLSIEDTGPGWTELIKNL